LARPNKLIIILGKLLVSSGLLYFVISKTGADKVLSTLKDINPLAFLIAVSIYIFAIFISSLRWRLLLHEGFELRKLFSLYFIGSFFNHLLPGIIGGDAVKAYYLYKDIGKGAPAIASVFMDRYIGFTALMFVGLSAFPFGLRYFRGSYIEWILPLMVFLFILVSFVIFGLKVGQRIRLLSGFYDYFSLYKGKKPVILKTFLLSLVVQVVIIFAVYVLCLGLKIEVPLLPLFIFIPIISTVSSVPISISGLGVRETSFVLLFGSLGIPPAQATAVSFVYFLSVATGSLPGLIEYLRYKKKR
jgi:uncharacterized membrane protein YbhN (UPF0104 family)